MSEMWSVSSFLGTLIAIAHRLATVRRCDQAIRLSGGRTTGRGMFEEVRV